MERTRRSLLAGAASVGVVGAAGCLGGGGGGTTLDLSGVDLDTGEYDCDLAEPSDPNLDHRPTLGDPESDVVVRAFEDFTCGHCASYTLDHFPAIREEYVESGEIRYEHWDFPIPVNETWAVPVASAARGVGARNGSEAFFEFASAAYESQGSYSGEAIGAAAEAAGADPCAAMSDARFAAYGEASADDRSEGTSMGVEGTPTIFVNGEPVDTYEAATVGAAIDEAL
ncbi:MULTISPECIES: thioredoxin domain-containing protein [unclassified Halorubrum]|uniref:DsbA family protein n=1 Tax=unclassified Halorubrum TaxID=2642239 RepID=UPI000B9816A1|nr:MULTISPECIES: thioredoxin domain-containing protein [unclassified Halorubrum]OYR43111.1 disulfide bond formation protein DsbA [Halorubrum sp. Hd13]OYR48445.1 disulfide bond formation protein DsbA [Halorubrum sp. Eb13]OYR51623.1 disulfide bond formation protein DsbA [Halorubrum sp. Ea1]